ncbi:immunoglobulin domain-containing protein [Paenibacillus sp. FSL M8-0212]|uniref:immunoglobulin domain-containing protein n=1 Tax=Paenibacillus sp. FSL M8-0212 TaxID=2921618 RepID=UPI0030F90617
MYNKPNRFLFVFKIFSIVCLTFSITLYNFVPNQAYASSNVSIRVINDPVGSFIDSTVGLPNGKIGLMYYSNNAKEIWYKVVKADGTVEFDKKLFDFGTNRSYKVFPFATSTGDTVIPYIEDLNNMNSGGEYKYMVVDKNGNVGSSSSFATSTYMTYPTGAALLSNGGVAITFHSDIPSLYDYELQFYDSNQSLVRTVLFQDRIDRNEKYYPVIANNNDRLLLTSKTDSGYQATLYDNSGNKIKDVVSGANLRATALSNSNFAIISGDASSQMSMSIYDQNGNVVGSPVVIGGPLGPVSSGYKATMPNPLILSKADGKIVFYNFNGNNNTVKMKEFTNTGSLSKDWYTIDSAASSEYGYVPYSGYEGGFGVYNDVTGFLTYEPSTQAPVAPAITSQPSDQTVTEGQTATFSVTASGDAPLSYQWKKSGTDITGATSAILTVTNAQAVDAGSYTVKVTNTAGNVTSNAASLTVNPAPVSPAITSQPSDQTVTEGQTATFSVTASGDAPLSYQWKKNGTDITGATSATLTITNAQKVDEGSYTVEVTNTAGNVTSNAALLTVNPAPVTPVITSQPSDQTVTEGQTATFSVTASGDAPLSYQWKKNGTDINGATSSTLTVTNAQKVDEGSYTVEVTNTAGNVTSNAALLTVNPVLVSPAITSQPSDQTVTEGQTATFSVTASGDTPLSYQWKKNGTDINGATSSTLTVTNAQSVDAGSYTVEVTNTAGNVTSNAALLTVNPVLVSPAITSQPSDQTVTEGQTATFSVTASGDTPLSYQWKKNGTDINGATSSTLTVTNAQSVDAGSYTVEVTNTAGNVTSNAALLTVNSVSLPGPISPTTATFDKNTTNTLAGSYRDVETTMSLNGNMLINIANGVTLLSGGIDYTVSGSTVTIKKEYLATQPVGLTTLTLNFSAGTAQTLTLTVRDTTTSTPIPSNPTPSNPTPSPSTPPLIPQTPGTTGVDVIVNGKVENAGIATTIQQGGQTITTVVVDEKKLEQRLEAEGNGAVIIIPVNTNSDVVIGELNGQMVKNMENRQATVVIRTKNASYTLPAKQMNIDALSQQVGSNVQLQDIIIKIEIAEPKAETVQVVEKAASSGNFELVVPAMDFAVYTSYGDQTVEISKFNAYVERTIAIPAGIDPNKITTGVVVEPDGAVRHVPTKVVRTEDTYFAKINSLTNSTYSIVWHPLVFNDAANHWAKEAVNDMGSRMVINGFEDGTFKPNQNMTRAEFAAIIVRGLGLRLENGEAPFSDIQSADWYNAAVQTASAFKLIDGFEDGTFHPNDSITREQAMVIIAKAMTISGLKDKLKLQGQDAATLLGQFVDANKVSIWAKAGVSDALLAGIVTGRNGNILDSKAYVTRAEVATMIRNLLIQSELI